MKKLSASFYVACLVFWGAVLFVRVPRVAQAFWLVDERGHLVNEGLVLGREDKKEDKEKEDVRTEIRTSEGERVETRVKDGETWTEIRSGGNRIKLERRDDRVKLKMETENGEEELGEQQELRIREREDKDEIEVEAGGKEGEFVVRRGQIEAKTDFPLSVNLETNELVVTTPAGERTVAVLPDQAVAGMLGANVLDRLASPSGASVTLGERQGVAVYQILGVKHHKFLGFIPVQTEVTAVVSAETGELVTTEDVSLVEQVIGALSF